MFEGTKLTFYSIFLHRHNHPETLVYCQDSSALLKQAVAQFNNEHPTPLLSNDRKTLCPDMPDKNSSIDFIFGGMYISLFFGIVAEFFVSKGPPCQSFSRANVNKVIILLTFEVLILHYFAEKE